jgi:hypothetical protein
MRWVGYVARIGEISSGYRTLVGNMKGRTHSEDIDPDGKIIL